MSQSEHPELTYNFADFELGSALEDPIVKLEDMVEDANRSLKTIMGLRGAVIDLLKEAFAAFKREGRWDFEGTYIEWWPKFDAQFWPNSFPIDIRLTPVDLVQSVARQLKDVSHPDDIKIIRDMLEVWRTALDESEKLLADR